MMNASRPPSRAARPRPIGITAREAARRGGDPGNRSVASRSAHRRWSGNAPTTALLLIPILLAVGAGTAQAQEELRNYTDPILVAGGGAHSAPIWSLVFSPDGQTLLSAGQDKVVHRWDLRDGRPRVVQTIRPPIWRGLRGEIYAMALSPAADADGGRLLAVAGYGADTPGGSILLYRLSDREDRPTGDLIAVLSSARTDTPADLAKTPEGRRGHVGAVTALAFSPDGTRLISGGKDGVARLWDVGQRVNSLNYPNGGSPITALGFSPDGRRLVVASEDGSLRLRDLATGAQVAVNRPGPDQIRDIQPEGVAITALAASPDGRWLAVGRDNGFLLRFDAQNLGNPAILRRGDRQGGVKALAFSADSTTLVSSTLSRPFADPSERPRTECDIELIRVIDGQVLLQLPRTADLARACAFSPDGRWLAVGGGDRQAVALKDLGDPARPIVELRGQGSSLWDVGFAPEGLVVAFARTRPPGDGPAGAYSGFDLIERRFVDVDPAGLRRAERTYQGWSVRPIGPRALDVIDPRGVRRFGIALDDTRGRWWSTTFLPPGPGHDEAALAVGTEGGISVYRLADGVRTRELAGHGAPVYALAPSPDGRWLVSGSSDQTIRLWALDGRDVVPPLGASIREDEQGNWIVAEVVPGSPAEQVGVTAGDIIDEVFVDSDTPVPIEQFLARADQAEPGAIVRLDVRSGGQRFSLGTTKKDSPALSLFPGVDREWVVWTPQGFYDTSIAGDHRLLGWHVNRLANLANFTSLQPSGYFPMSRYEQQLRRPEVLDDLLAGRERAPQPAPAIPVPPTVTLSTPGREPGRPAERPEFPLSVTALASEGRRIVAVELRNGGEVQERREFAEEQVDQVELPELIARLRPGSNRLTVVAVDDGGLVGVSQLDLTLAEPEPTPRRPSRLVVRTIGIEQFRDATIPRIDHAGRDAADLERFLIAPGERPRYRSDAIDSRVLSGDEATAGAIAEVFASLRADGKGEGDSLQAGDSVFVAIESHFIDFDDGTDTILAADSSGGPEPRPAVPASMVADRLGALAAGGCNVVLMLDIVHDRPETDRLDRMKEWVRDLGYSRDVITLLASKDGAGLRWTDSAHGLFTHAVISSFDVRGAVRPFVDPKGPLTLDDFEATVVQLVDELSTGRQAAGVYASEAIPPQLLLFDPVSPPAGSP